MTLGELIAFIRSLFDKSKIHLLSKPHIVRFQDDSYGIRRKDFVASWEYLDLISQNFWWSADSKYIKDCKGTQEKATRIFNEKYGSKSVTKDKGTPI